MRTEKVLVWRAYSVWADRANRTYPADRVCDADECDTRLSIYNGSTLCWQHEPSHRFVLRIERNPDTADPWPEGYRVADTWGVTGGLAMTQAEDPAAE